jgi:hypothetical protein
MKFVEIKDTKQNSMAINPQYIAFITHDHATNTSTIVFSNDRRMQTKMFRSVNEAVKWCKSTEVDTAGIGGEQ